MNREKFIQAINDIAYTPSKAVGNGCIIVQTESVADLATEYAITKLEKLIDKWSYYGTATGEAKAVAIKEIDAAINSLREG